MWPKRLDATSLFNFVVSFSLRAGKAVLCLGLVLSKNACDTQQEGGRQQDKAAVQSLSARKFVANCRFVRLLFSPSQEKFDAVRKKE